MSVTEPAYITREAVKKALDVKGTSRSDDDVDRAIQAGSRAWWSDPIKWLSYNTIK